VAGRAFVVRAGIVKVQVTGTVFVVDVGTGKVSVTVEEGRVHVVGPRGDVELGPGDHLGTAVDSSPTAAAGAAPRAARIDPGGPLSASALWDRADEQRRAGDFEAAAATLREFVVRHPRDAHAPDGWFTLAKVERARDRPSAAAKAFHTCFSLSPGGPLAEDALAEEAAAWSLSSHTAQARAAAQRYLRTFPNGAHVARMQRVLE
jgi:TolA-binding protein